MTAHLFDPKKFSPTKLRVIEEPLINVQEEGNLYVYLSLSSLSVLANLLPPVHVFRPQNRQHMV